MGMSSFFKAFGYALNGIRSFVVQERNARIHLICTILVITLSIILKISKIEWMFIGSAIAGVWVAEMLNTAIEKLCDMVSQQVHPTIKLIKDIAAGAVLIASIYALFIGVIILIPKFL